MEIEYFKITNIDFPKLLFKVKCGKGTYIRSLAFDYGKALNNGAFLSKLKREKIGKYCLENAMSINQFREKILN